MNRKRLMIWSLAALLLLALTAPALAQDNRAALKTTQANVSECSAELFEQADQSFRKRRSGSEMLHVAERRLSEVVRVCKGTSGGLHAEDNLRVVHEELAEHNLAIARFYLSRFYCGRGGQAGARSRLETNVERYPHYSRFDEVLFLLGRIYVTDGKTNEAATLLRRLITEYPGSQYSGEAAVGLLEIDALKIDRTPAP